MGFAFLLEEGCFCTEADGRRPHTGLLSPKEEALPFPNLLFVPAKEIQWPGMGDAIWKGRSLELGFQDISQQTQMGDILKSC